MATDLVGDLFDVQMVLRALAARVSEMEDYREGFVHTDAATELRRVLALVERSVERMALDVSNGTYIPVAS